MKGAKGFVAFCRLAIIQLTIELGLIMPVPCLGAEVTDIAFLVKTSGEVAAWRENLGRWFDKVTIGFRLNSGDRVRTRQGATAWIMFTDDRSRLVVRGNSDVVISGSRNQELLDKQVRIDSGSLVFTVPEQRHPFEVVSPAVRVMINNGTGLIRYDPGEATQVSLLDGTALVVSRISGDSVRIGGSEICMAGDKGELSVSSTASSEIVEAIGQKTVSELVSGAGKLPGKREIIIEFRDGRGVIRRIRMPYVRIH